jgi:uncharacterized membrane protein
MAWFRTGPQAVPPPIRKNITSLVQLEEELASRRTGLDRLSDAITRFTGSIQFVIAHAIIFAVWVGINTAMILGVHVFDPYPYVFLNLVLAMEAVLLGTFVLMSQNRQNRQADLWLHMVLQLGMLSEQESTKTLQLLRRICQCLDIKDAQGDRELSQLIEKTHIEALAEELEKSREQEESHPGS